MRIDIKSSTDVEIFCASVHLGLHSAYMHSVLNLYLPCLKVHLGI